MRGTYYRDAPRVVRWSARCGNDRQGAARHRARDDTGPWRAGTVNTGRLFLPGPNGLAGPGGESVLPGAARTGTPEHCDCQSR